MRYMLIMRVTDAAVEATMIAGGARKAEIAAPAAIASSATLGPSRRWTMSRSTSARPIISTPLGAASPGATGTRQGPSGTQTVPT